MRYLVVAAGKTASLAIRQHAPDLVIYIAAPEDMLGEFSPPAITQPLDLTESRMRVIVLTEPALSDIKTCYDQLLAELQQLHQPDDTYLVDYRTAWPALTAALTLVALHYDNYQLIVIKPGAVTALPDADKRQLAIHVHSAPALTADKAAVIDALVNKYHYGPATEYLRALLRYPGWKRETVAELNNLLHGFDAWDKFRYSDALTRLNATRLRDTYVPMLRRLTGEVKGNGFEPVFDLLLNAERMAARGWYDDAAARVYRAVELFAVCYLKKAHKQDATNLDLAKLPQPLQAKYGRYTFDNGTVKIGAMICYELLVDMNDAFIGPVYNAARDILVTQVLRVRNESKLAHGEPAITLAAYAGMRGYADDFLGRCGAAIGLKNDMLQFPDQLKVGAFFT